jgi:nucleoside phosphorylase
MMEDRADIVIVTALRLECDAVLRRMPDAQRLLTKNRTYFRSTLQATNGVAHTVVVLSLAGMGNVSAATATTQAIDVWNPDSIFLVGITGGIKDGDKRRLGDLIVAEQIVAYEPGKLTSGGVQHRYQVYRSSHELLNVARELVQTNWVSKIELPRPAAKTVTPQVHFGVSASGEKVFASVRETKSLQADWRQLIGIEMEGVGVALAAYQAENPPGILQVKAICDWADSSKNDAWQMYAADVAATFVMELINSGHLIPPAKERAQPRRSDAVQFSGRHKIRLCQRLGIEWQDLSDYFEIPMHLRARFPTGRECQGIWEWLEAREKLAALMDALAFIGREDLAELLKGPAE